MKGLELAAMSTDDLWSLRTEVVQLLQQKIKAEQQSLEMRLRMLSGKLFKERFSVRRPYPPVLPKYRNPDRPSETWAGRGKQPHWLVAHLKSGRRIDDFAIRKAANR